MLASFLAVIATLLAAIGLYGLMTYSVTRRTREIGIRVAFGAVAGDVFRLVFRQALTYLGLGLVIGIPLALFAARYLESQLFGLAAVDPVTVTGAAAILAGATFLATFVPGRRAAMIDPARALRDE